MMNALVWLSSEMRTLGAALWKESKEPRVLVSGTLPATFEEVSEEDRMVDIRGVLPSDFIPKWECMEVCASTNSTELVSLVRPLDETTLVYFLLGYPNGLDIAVFSPDISCADLLQIFGRNRETWFGKDGALAARIPKIVSKAGYSVWFDAPDDDSISSSALIISANLDYLQRVQQQADLMGLPGFGGYEETCQLRNPKKAHTYLADAEAELKRFSDSG